MKKQKQKSAKTPNFSIVERYHKSPYPSITVWFLYQNLIRVETENWLLQLFPPQIFRVPKPDINSLHQDTLHQSQSLNKFHPVDQLVW